MWIDARGRGARGHVVEGGRTYATVLREDGVRLRIHRENLLEEDHAPLRTIVTDIDRAQVRFDVGDIDINALLFQTGYLTINSEESEGDETFYTLDYPNFEVRQSLNRWLLRHLGKEGRKASDQGRELGRLLASNDFDGFAAHLRSFFAGVPYQWQTEKGPARYEAWYAGMLYACLNSIGLDVRAEESSSRGRADMVVLHDGQAFVLEFKLAAAGADAAAVARAALAQIRERGYAAKYRRGGGPVFLLGIAFGQEEKNLVALEAEPA